MSKLAEFLASYTSDFPEAKPLLQEYEGLCSVNADLLEALRDLVARCDGSEGVRADGSNIDTLAAHIAITKAEGV